jgi:hypothetical protein
MPDRFPSLVLISATSRARARWLSSIALGLAVMVAMAARFGLNDGGWSLLVPVVACAAATAWPTRIVVAIAMLASAAVVVLGLDGSGVLFAASVAGLMLALNNLQAAATQIRRKPARRP